MKIFKCDKCGKEFPQPLDEEKIIDEHGIAQVYDLCAPCRGLLKIEKEKPIKEFLKALKKGNKNG